MKQHRFAKPGFAPAIYLVALIISTPASAQGIVNSHRVSSVVAAELVAGAVAACRDQGYNVTATLVDSDGVRQATLRGDGAGILTLDTSNDKAYTAIAFRTDTGVLVERAKATPLSQIFLKEPHMLLAQGGIVIKAGEEFIAGLGVGGAPGGEKDEACARAALDKVTAQLK